MREHVDELLARRREEALRTEEESAVARHLADCARCRGLADEFVRADALLATSEPSLPLPPLRAARPRWRLSPLVATGLLMIVALAVGVGLAEWRSDREQIAEDPAPTPPGEPELVYRPGRDLVYVAAGSTGDRRLIAIAMPEGRLIHDYELPFGSIYRDVTPTLSFTHEFAFFSRTVVEDLRTFHTYLERIELRTGERRSVDAGSVRYAGALALGDHEARTEDLSEEEIEERLRSQAEGAATAYAQVVASGDGSKVLLIRQHAGSSSTLRVDHFDGRTLAHLGTRIWDVQRPATGHASAQVFLIDAAHSLFVRYEHPDDFSQRQIWTFLDAELRDVASVSGATDEDWPNYCSPDLRALPDGRTWATVCHRHSRTYFVQLINGERLADAGKVELSGGERALWDVLSWHVAIDGTILVLTDRPSLVLVDPFEGRVIDHRLVTSDVAIRQPHEGPAPTAFPRVQWRADGRFLYVAYLGYDGRSWWAPLSLIDVESGSVVATALEGPGVSAVALSPDGARLYAIDDGRLLLLDPGTLEVLSVIDHLVTAPGAILRIVSLD